MSANLFWVGMKNKNLHCLWYLVICWSEMHRMQRKTLKNFYPFLALCIIFFYFSFLKPLSYITVYPWITVLRHFQLSCPSSTSYKMEQLLCVCCAFQHPEASAKASTAQAHDPKLPFKYAFQFWFPKSDQKMWKCHYCKAVGLYFKAHLKLDKL